MTTSILGPSNAIPSSPSSSILGGSAAAPAPVTFRNFGDTLATRRAIYDNALEAARNIKPVKNNRYTLHIENVGYADPEELPIATQKKALLERGTLSRRLRGTWVLTGADGSRQERQATLAKIPFMTDRGNFIVNGTSYTLAHQMRLLPGIYTRQQENGEISSHANVLPGKGVSHHYSMDPATGIFRLDILQSSMPLLPILQAIGAKERELRDAWGDDLYERNTKKSDPKVIDKLYRKLVRKPNPEAHTADKEKAIAEAFAGMEFDPEVNRRTLGEPVRNLNKDEILKITKRLLAVNRGEADTDDRDHLANQRFLGPEDLIAERLQRSGSLMNQALWKATNKGNLDSIPVDAFGRHVSSAILDSGLGQPGEEVNASEIFDHQFRISRLGTGGIPDVSAIPAESRNVHPSQLGYIDLVKTPESFRAGVDLRIANSVRKGSDGRIYAPFTDAKTGREHYLSPQDLVDKVVTFPGQLESGEPHVEALHGGKNRVVPRERVDFVAPHGERWFSPLTNLTPFKSMDKAQRAAMGSRFTSQALPLLDPESPLVRTAIPDGSGRTFHREFSPHMGAVYAENRPGRVTAVSKDAIDVVYADGSRKSYQLYNNFPYNQKTYLHNTPSVQPGDVVQPGQLLAKSNYTDAEGNFAVGKNLRVAYTSLGGRNYEDAWVISESAAKKLSSENLYQHELVHDDSIRGGKKNYLSIFPSTHSREAIANMDADGAIKPGSRVRPGDPLVLAAAARPVTHKTVFSSHKGSFVDRSVTWDQHVEGEVTDVAKTKDGITVAVKAVKPMYVGDKLAGVHGDKGVVAQIVPDDQMPRDPKTGLAYEVLANPLGVISRTNAAQAAEAWLGKIAAATGKPELARDFSGDPDLMATVQRRLAEHGLEGYEDIEDPANGRRAKVATGMRYYMKLHHTSAGKHQGRGLGAYTADDEPARGGPEGAKKTALMNVNAYLAHNALDVLRDIKLIKGQKNHEYWATAMAGFKPASPPTPKVYRKFVDSLRAAGVNVRRNGSKLHLLAMSDQDVDDLAGDRNLQNAETVDWKEGYKPVAGGLFDAAMTGGHGGNKWSAIPLHEPLPLPVMEEPIRHLLDLTKKDYEAVIAGDKSLGGDTGPAAIKKALGKLRLDDEIYRCRQDIAGSRKGARDIAIRKLGYLKACQNNGTHPRDWVVSRVPVLPPLFRGVSQMQGGAQLVDDANVLYKELFDANQMLKDLSGKTDNLREERLNAYKAFKAVTGLGDPTRPKNQERGVKGLLAHVFGSSPKTSMVQQKLIGNTMDLVGRAVIIPDPDLSMDEVGIPEPRAWEVYAPSIVRRLVRNGMKHTEAMLAVKNRTKLAAKAMLDEMDEHPVIASRAPVLHKHGQLAFFPRLVKGDTLRLSPLVVGGLGADFDGDRQISQVVVAVDKLNSAAILSQCGEDLSHWEDRKMAARFNVSVPAVSAHDFFCVNLEDFPHGDVIRKNDRITFHAVPPGIRVLAYDERAGRMTLADVAGWSVHTGCKTVLVELQSGRQIITDDDPRAVYGLDPATFEFVRRRPADSLGLLVPRADRFCGWSESLPEVAGGEGRRVLTTIKLTRDFGRLLGMLVGNGWVSQSTTSPQVHFAATDRNVVARFNAALSSVFIDPPQVTRTHREAGDPGGLGESTRWTISSVEFGRLLSRVLDMKPGKTARTKRLPPFALAAPTEFRIGLVEGLLDTDGSVAVSNAKERPQLIVNYTSASVRLVQEIQHLLRSLNVASRISPTKTPAGEPFWVLNISTVGVVKLPLDLSHTGKAQVWSSKPMPREDAPSVAKNDVVPFPAAVADEVARLVRNEGQPSLASLVSAAKKKNTISRLSAAKIVKICKGNVSDALWTMFCQFVADTDTSWDRVKSYQETDSVDTGYDLTVPGFETFMATDGLVLSNTMNYEVSAGDEAAKEALYKMLPSRNLISGSDFKKPVHQPRQEYVGGLHALTSQVDTEQRPRPYRSVQDVIRAWRRAEIEHHHRVEIPD